MYMCIDMVMHNYKVFIPEYVASIDSRRCQIALAVPVKI